MLLSLAIRTKEVLLCGEVPCEDCIERVECSFYCDAFCDDCDECDKCEYCRCNDCPNIDCDGQNSDGEECNGKDCDLLSAPQRKSRRNVHKYLAQLLDRDGEICGCCKLPIVGRDYLNLHVDHIQPKSKGGTDDFDNLQATHKRCNLAKGAKVW